MNCTDTFPLLLPVNDSFNEYEGFVPLGGKDEPIRVKMPKGQTKGSIMCSKRLLAVLSGHEELIFERMARSRDMSSFLVEMKDILERLYQAKEMETLPHPSYYNTLVSQLRMVGFEKLIHCNDLLTELDIMLSDAGNREHILRVKLEPDYPSSPPQCTIALPLPASSVPASSNSKSTFGLEFDWAPSSSLSNVVQQYERALHYYQEFWNQLDDLDSNTWVLEPENPGRDCTMRRIAVAKHCSIVIEIDPQSPRSYPESRLMGADHAVKPLREAMHGNIGVWDSEQSLRCNLERVLGVSLPSPASSGVEEYSGECGICYAYRMDSSIPDVVCENASCSKPYHQHCLLEWLRSMPDTRRSFDTLFGVCPYCSDPIACRGSSM